MQEGSKERKAMLRNQELDALADQLNIMCGKSAPPRAALQRAVQEEFSAKRFISCRENGMRLLVPF